MSTSMWIATAIAVMSLIIVAPNISRTVRDWRGYGRSQRATETVLLLLLLLIPMLGFIGAYLADSEVNALENRMAPRHLSDYQARTLEHALRPFHGSVVSIAAYLPAPDAHGLAEEVLATFQKAGWIIKGRPGLKPDVIDVDMGGGVVPQVTVGCSDPQNPTEAAAAAYKAFQDVGLLPEYQSVGISTNELQVTIGPKPLSP